MLKNLFGAAIALAAATGGLAAADLETTLKGIENRYNHVKTLQVNFSETSTFQKRTIGPETGTLYLEKPGKMRWQYAMPAGKLWISDGTNVYDYSPQDKRVRQGKLKDAQDLQAPLAFLLGKLDFKEQFGKFDSMPRGQDMVVIAYPKSDKSPFTEVDFTSTPDFSIKELTVTRQDGYVIHYLFSDEKKSPPVQASMFKFTPPPGAEVVPQ